MASRPAGNADIAAEFLDVAATDGDTLAAMQGIGYALLAVADQLADASEGATETGDVFDDVPWDAGCGQVVPLRPAGDRDGQPGFHQGSVPGAVAADLYSRLDGLRTYLDRVLCDELRDRETALELASAELAEVCQQAPEWCPGCVGRGTGTVCCMCGAPVPAVLRRRPGDPAEVRADCPDCAAGNRHVHAPAAREASVPS